MILVKIYFFLYSLGSMQYSLPLRILTFRLRKRTSQLSSNMHRRLELCEDENDSIVLLWRSPSLFRWIMFIFEMHLLVGHSEIVVYKALLNVFQPWNWTKHTSFCLNSIAYKYCSLTNSKWLYLKIKWWAWWKCIDFFTLEVQFWKRLKRKRDLQLTLNEWFIALL